MLGKSLYKGLAALTVAALFLSACASGTPAPPTETAVPAPIRVGSTLALTGSLAATAIIHKLIGEIYVEKLNESGGLLGRPVEWVLLDDESTPDKAAALYERLITEENVDLILGPYGSGNITAAMQVAERYEKVFIHHTGSLTYAYTYKWHFPMWYTGLNTHKTTPDLLYDALDASGSPPHPSRRASTTTTSIRGTSSAARASTTGETASSPTRSPPCSSRSGSSRATARRASLPPVMPISASSPTSRRTPSSSRRSSSPAAWPRSRGR